MTMNKSYKIKFSLATVILFTVLLFCASLKGKADNDGKKRASTIRLPVIFVSNYGQWRKDILFAAPGPGMQVLIKKDGIVLPYSLRNHKTFNNKNGFPDEFKSISSDIIAIKFYNDLPAYSIKGIRESRTKFQFYLGQDSSKWLEGITSYKSVKYENVWKNINAVVDVNGNNIEHTFEIKPDGNIENAIIQLQGGKIKRKTKYDLLILDNRKAIGEIKLKRAYTVLSGDTLIIPCELQTTSNNSYTFKMTVGDSSTTVIIETEFSTYFGGSIDDRILCSGHF